MNMRYWRQGIKNTLAFYRNKLFYKEKQFNFSSPLKNYFGEMIGDKKEVKIADLGAGLFSTTGSTWPTVTVHIYASDILADEYNQILKDNHVTSLIPIINQDMTELTYDNEFFDIVHCVNALDHCSDPILALKEMYRICKKDGWIYLRHFYNNADYENYKGFHMWNICNTDTNDCLIWNKKDRFLLSDYFEGYKTTTQENVDKRERVVISTLHKI
jgi:ubiquinone/menaquinone biosynthesis C-methylase UbiE